MWSVRKGNTWAVEGGVVWEGWRGRIVAIYEDQSTATGSLRPILSKIIAIWGNDEEFLSDSLEELREPCVTEQELHELGRWYGMQSALVRNRLLGMLILDVRIKNRTLSSMFHGHRSETHIKENWNLQIYNDIFIFGSLSDETQIFSRRFGKFY